MRRRSRPCSANENFGGSIALSDDGNTLVVGAENHDGLAMTTGLVRVFGWSNGAWTQIGADLDQPTANLQLGRSVAVSANGTRVLGGGPAGMGKMFFFERSGETFTQPSAPDFGTNARTGECVAISPDGRVAAVGAIYSSANGSSSGEVRIYRLPD